MGKHNLNKKLKQKRKIDYNLKSAAFCRLAFFIYLINPLIFSIINNILNFNNCQVLLKKIAIFS